MPSNQENLQLLYLILTNGGQPSIDLLAISRDLNLNPGTTFKRWSRLKQAMTAGKDPGPTAYDFLRLCVKHSSRDKALDWHTVAARCGTTPGAAAKRYSRMKAALKKNHGPTRMPAKGGKGGAAPPAKAVGGSAEALPSPSSPLKRKRATPSSAARRKKRNVERYTPDDQQQAEGEEAEAVETYARTGQRGRKSGKTRVAEEAVGDRYEGEEEEEKRYIPDEEYKENNAKTQPEPRKQKKTQRAGFTGNHSKHEAADGDNFVSAHDSAPVSPVDTQNQPEAAMYASHGDVLWWNYEFEEI